MKYALIVLGVLLGLACWRIDTLTKENAVLETEVKTLTKEKESYKDAQISSSKLIKELRIERAKQSPDVDCGSIALPEYVIRVFDQLK